MYTVAIGDDGTFTAEYNQPSALSVPLGISGSTVEARINEDRTFSVMIDGEWMVVTADTQVTAANGNVYGVQFVDGVPIPTYLGHSQPVMLGELGGEVTLTRAEDMTWWLGETAVADGYVHTAENGNMYALTLDSEGMWSAMYQQVEVMVALGTQGSVTLVRAEDMSWWLGSEAVDVASEVMSESGNTYTLWYTDGVWSARFEPESMMIEGTGLVAMTKEDRSGYDVDGEDLPGALPALGTDIDTSMGTYRVTMMDGMLMGTRLDKVAIDGNTDNWNTAGLNSTPFIRVDEDNTEDMNEAATALVIDGENHPFSALLGSGMSQTTGKNYVAEARDELIEIRDRIEAVLDVFDDDTQRDTQIELLWGANTDDGANRMQNVEDVLDEAFGSGNGATDETNLITEAPDADDALDKIDDLIMALSSVDGLAAAFGDDGVLKELGVGDGDKTATQIFDAVESETTVSYGALGMTRFGAIYKTGRTNALSDAKHEHDTQEDGDNDSDSVEDGLGQLGGFSFGVTGETVRARHVMSSGNAYYEGTTLAVDQGGTHYSGDISVRVRFATNPFKVDGLITNLRSADGDPWVYLFDDVETIVLPTANMNASGIWNQQSGQASASFALRAGSPAAQRLASTFSGRLLGTGDNAGYQTVGTWSVASASLPLDGDDSGQPNPDATSYLAGGFGAERVADEPDRRPEVDDGTGVEAMLSGDMTALEDGKLTITAAKFGWTRTGELAADGSSYAWAQQDDGDAETTGDTTDATRKYEIDLGWLVPREGAESGFTGNSPKYVDMAREMIETERTKLAVLIETDQLGGPGEAQELIWRRVQEILLVYVFNAERTGDWSERLPTKVSGGYDADSALDTVDDVLHALSSLSNLESALDKDESALFVGSATNDEADFTYNRDPVDRSDIWGERDSQVRLWIGTTDFTRFGVWRVRRSRNALRRGGWDDSEIEAFAYSPLPVSTVSDVSAPNYSPGGTATYTGSTVAFVGNPDRDTGAGNPAPIGYEGDVAVHVTWNPTAVGASLTTVISNFVSGADGDSLYHSSSPVRELVFSTLAFTAGDDNKLMFASGATGTTFGGGVSVHYVDRNATAAAVTEATLSGAFVGSSADGPLALIGRYTLPDSDFDVAASTRDDVVIHGAFGAELP